MARTGEDPAPGAADAAVTELFVVPPEQFVARRKELVAELRAAGDRSAATELAAMRRPPRSAWALNVIARERPDLVTAVLTAARTVTESLSAGSDGLRDDLSAYRSATDALLDAAAAATDTHASDWRDRMRATVQAAGDDPDLAELLVAGRLSDDHAATGLGGGAAMVAPRRSRTPSATAGASTSPARKTPAKQSPTGKAQSSKAATEAAAASRASAAAAAAERARKEAERVRLAKERARLIRELDRARTRAERLERSAAEARAAADDAARVADDLEARLRRLAE